MHLFVTGTQELGGGRDKTGERRDEGEGGKSKEERRGEEEGGRW